MRSSGGRLQATLLPPLQASPEGTSYGQATHCPLAGRRRGDLAPDRCHASTGQCLRLCLWVLSCRSDLRATGHAPLLGVALRTRHLAAAAPGACGTCLAAPRVACCGKCACWASGPRLSGAAGAPAPAQTAQASKLKGEVVPGEPKPDLTRGLRRGAGRRVPLDVQSARRPQHDHRG